MTCIRISACPKCHREPTVYKPFSRKGYAVTCERCGGLLALGNDRDSAIICWNNRVADDYR